MVTSYGKTSGFMAVDADELMLVNGGKGSSGGGGGGSSGSGSNSSSSSSSGSGSKSSTPKSSTPVNVPTPRPGSSISNEKYITDARLADAMKPTPPKKESSGTTAVFAALTIASLVSPPLLAVILGTITNTGTAH